MDGNGLPTDKALYDTKTGRDSHFWLNPFKIKWPKEVHEWTGETINWH
jgi:hypothetical protein